MGAFKAAAISAGSTAMPSIPCSVAVELLRLRLAFDCSEAALSLRLREELIDDKEELSVEDSKAKELLLVVRRLTEPKLFDDVPLRDDLDDVKEGATEAVLLNFSFLRSSFVD